MCSVVYKRNVTFFEVCFMCVCVWAVKSKQLLDIRCLHIYFDHLMIKWNANPWFQTKMQMTTCLCPSPPQSPWPRSQLLPNLRRPREPKKVSPVWVCTMCPTRVLCTMRSGQVFYSIRPAQVLRTVCSAWVLSTMRSAQILSCVLDRYYVPCALQR